MSLAVSKRVAVLAFPTRSPVIDVVVISFVPSLNPSTIAVSFTFIFVAFLNVSSAQVRGGVMSGILSS
jgi:hypothetical protein